MKLRNKAGTSYKGIAPGAVFELPDFEAYELLKALPWHFEIVGGRDGEERGSASPRVASGSREAKSPPSASPKAHESEPAPAPKKKRGRWG